MRLKLQMMAALLLVIGGLNWGIIGVTKVNLLDKVPRWLSRSVYILVGLAALYNLFRRNYYLPFLGSSAFPCGPMMVKTPDNANVQATVKVKPDVNVIYWAAEEHDAIVENPWLAYGKNSNSGVARSSETGEAVLNVRMPASYKVPSGRVLTPHIHYRVCHHDGMLGPVKTTMVRA